MAGDDLLAAFGAEGFIESAASGQRMDNIGRSIVARVLEHAMFYDDYLVFFLLDGSEVAVKMDE